MSTRLSFMFLRLVAITTVVALAGACGGSDDDATAADEPSAPADEGGFGGGSDDTTGEDPTGGDDDVADPVSSPSTDAASYVDIDGEIYEFTTVIDCIVGDAFWGPDFRRISLDTDGGYPGISVGYAPPKADNEGVEDPNGVAVFPSVDPWWFTTDAATAPDLDITLTADGVIGSATMGVQGQGGPDGEVTATFELSCSAPAGSDDDSSGSDDEPGVDDPGTAPDLDVGTVTFDGETHELAGPTRSDAMLDDDLDPSGDFDLEICETVNPAFEGEFNIAGTLGDGTSFRLSGNVNEPFDDLDGLFLGEVPDEERAEIGDVALTGRTLSGTASTSRGDLEFSFTC